MFKNREGKAVTLIVQSRIGKDKIRYKTHWRGEEGKRNK